MRPIFFIICLVLSLQVFSQTHTRTQARKLPVVTFVAVLHKANATKDGIYLNGYVVNLPYERIKELDGKKIKVTGIVTTVGGIKNMPGTAEVQGRAEVTKHIESPKIKVLH